MWGIQSSFASTPSQPRFDREMSGTMRGGGDREIAVVQVEAEESVESAQVLHAEIGERTAQREVIGLRVVARERHLHLPAVPRLEDGQLVQQREPSVRDEAARHQTAQLLFSGERAQRGVARSRPSEIHALELVTVRQMLNAVIGYVGPP